LADAGTDPEPLSDDGCAQCRLIGAGWNSLRLGVSCGNIGCCDDSRTATLVSISRSPGTR